MDCAQLVQPGGFITRKSTINVEHQSYPLNDDKVETIYDYKLFLIHEENNVIQYRSHDQLYEVHYIVVTKGEIQKFLSILNDIIKNKIHLSEDEALYFAYIVIFVDKDDGKEVIKKLANLFFQINEIELKLQLDIHQVLKR